VLRARRLCGSRRRRDPRARRASLGLETASERPPPCSQALGFIEHPSSRRWSMTLQCVPRTKRLLIAGLLSACAVFRGTAQVEKQADYRPKLAVSESAEPFLKQLERSEEHTSELQSLAYLVCRLLL